MNLTLYIDNILYSAEQMRKNYENRGIHDEGMLYLGTRQRNYATICV